MAAPDGAGSPALPPLAGVQAAVLTASHGSFTAAAQALGLSVAAVSKNVAALETQLGVRLFNRTTRRVTLTEEGRAYVDAAGQGLAALQAAAGAATHGGPPRGLVRMTTAVGFGRHYVLPLLPAFRQRHPQVQVEIAFSDLAVDLVAEGFDIGIRGGMQPPEGMVARHLCDIVTVLVASPHYLARHGTPVHWRELAGHQLIRLKFLSGRSPPWLFRENGEAVALEFDAPLTLSDPELMAQAAALHLGVARVARHHVHEALLRGELVEVLAGQHLPGDSAMAIFYPHRAGLAPRVRVLVDHLVESLAVVPGLHAPRRARSGPPAAS
jgi:DNA-binding transcriptional LysR family regulator